MFRAEAAVAQEQRREVPGGKRGRGGQGRPVPSSPETRTACGGRTGRGGLGDPAGLGREGGNGSAAAADGSDPRRRPPPAPAAGKRRFLTAVPPPQGRPRSSAAHPGGCGETTEGANA